MINFFTINDFQAFDEQLAQSTDEKVIANRMETVNKLRNLHEFELRDMLQKMGLYPHWKKEHLTNVVWPLKQANGEYVDYIRMGYGKPKAKIQQLAKLVGLKIVDTNYVKDDMAFHHITQLQISLNQSKWSIALYLDKKGWIEEKNLTNKITKFPQYYKEFYMLLETILQEGYTLYLYSEIGNYYYEDINSYIDDIIKYSHSGVSYTIHISKELQPDDAHNDISIIADYIKSEFDILIDLYTFISWSENNNYIG